MILVTYVKIAYSICGKGAVWRQVAKGHIGANPFGVCGMAVMDGGAKGHVGIVVECVCFYIKNIDLKRHFISVLLHLI